MPFFSGFAGEFGRQLERSRSEEADRAERRSALESSVLQHLSTSPDPEIASHAIAGMLDLASPQRKSKGLAGWLGEVAVNPALPTIRQLIAGGRQVDVPAHVPAMQAQPGLSEMPGTPAAPPSPEALRPGAPGMAPAESRADVEATIAEAQAARQGASGPSGVSGATLAAQGPPAPSAGPGVAALAPVATPVAKPAAATAAASTASTASAATPPPPPLPAFAPGDVYRPPSTRTIQRHVFNTPEEQAQLTARATRRGTLQGSVDVIRGTGGTSPLTQEEQDLLFPGRALMAVGTVQGKDLPLGSFDNTGRPVEPASYYQGKADARDPSKTVYFPVSPPASIANQAAISARPTFQHYVGPDGKTPGVWRVYRDGAKPPEFVGYSGARGSYLQYEDPDTHEITYIAAPALFFQPGAPAAAAPAGGAAPAGAAPAPAAPSPAGGVPAVGVAPGPGATSPALAAVPPPAVGPPAGPQAGTPAAPAAAPPSGIPGGRKDRNFAQEQGAVIGPSGEPQVATALFDKGTGKYYSVQDPTKPAEGFIPGPEGAYAVTAYSQANNTLITIHAALKALEDAGVTTNNDPRATAALMARFYGGTTGGNPIDAAVASLTNLAGLQGATQYIRSNSRSYAMFQQALQHLPVAPTQRTAALSQVPVLGRAITPGSAAVFGGHGWDSFASMYVKLQTAEGIIQQGKGALAELTGKVAGRGVGAGATDQPGPVVGQRGVVNGVPAVWDGQGWKPVGGGG